jgi:hypothetical protein
LDYLMTRLGSAGPVSLGWELIPFSFVLDWFVDLRSICDNLDNLLTGYRKNITGVCISESFEYTAVSELRSSMSSYAPDNPRLLLASTDISYYRRDPVLNYNKVGLSGRFGKRQLGLSAALLNQKIANRIV